MGEGRGSLQICQPPARTRLDCPWPRSKVPLRATPLRIAHYPEADLFAVLTSRQVGAHRTLFVVPASWGCNQRLLLQ